VTVLCRHYHPREVASGYACVRYQVQIFTRDGAFVRKFGAIVLQHPRGVTVDFRGRIVVVECKVLESGTLTVLEQLLGSAGRTTLSKALETVLTETNSEGTKLLRHLNSELL